MKEALGGEMAELALALADCPGARATPAELATRLGRPLVVVSRALREAERRGVVGTATTLSAQLSRDRGVWLTADEGMRLLTKTDHGQAAGA